jgi:hypothetical protein
MRRTVLRLVVLSVHNHNLRSFDLKLTFGRPPPPLY